MGFDFLLVQPQAFIEKKKPHLILFPDKNLNFNQEGIA